METEAQRMNRMVTDLLSLSRVQGDRMPAPATRSIWAALYAP